MNDVLLFSLAMFFLACAAWIISIAASAIVRINRPWPYNLRGLLLFATVVALTLAMAAALLRASN